MDSEYQHAEAEPTALLDIRGHAQDEMHADSAAYMLPGILSDACPAIDPPTTELLAVFAPEPRAYTLSRQYPDVPSNSYGVLSQDPAVLSSTPSLESRNIPSLPEDVISLTPDASASIVDARSVTVDSSADPAHDSEIPELSSVALHDGLEATFLHQLDVPSSAINISPAPPVEHKAGNPDSDIAAEDIGSYEPPQDPHSDIDPGTCIVQASAELSAVHVACDASETGHSDALSPFVTTNPTAASTLPSHALSIAISARDTQDFNIDGNVLPMSPGGPAGALEGDLSASIPTTSIAIPAAAVLPLASNDRQAAFCIEVLVHYELGSATPDDFRATTSDGVVEDRVSLAHIVEDQMNSFDCLPPSGLPPSQVSGLSVVLDNTSVFPANEFMLLTSVEDIVPGHDTGDFHDNAYDVEVTASAEFVESEHTAAGGIASPHDDHEEPDLSPSSPPPSSSPFSVFSSPHPHQDPFDSPPSSSPAFPSYVEDSLGNARDQHDQISIVTEPVSTKPPLTFEAPSGSCRNHAVPELVESSSKHVKMELPGPQYDLPNPRPPTVASQTNQRRKLAAPFRSPVIKGPLLRGGLHAVYATGRAVGQSLPSKVQHDNLQDDDHVDGFCKPQVGVSNKDRTANAAKQFKSPLQVASTTNPESARVDSRSTTATTITSGGGARALPNIQALQGKVQTLKQAIKIKNPKSAGGAEDDVLEQLVQKWTTAGREVAWAVWEYVKDVDPGTDTGDGGWFGDGEAHVGQKRGRGFDPSWGYEDDDHHVQKKAKLELEFEGGVVEEVDTEEEGAQAGQHTLGVMLRRLGIDPATLGWDEEEGDFVDA